jgi:glycosyltransferase involved in cell wall biosynthesis
MVRQSPDLLFVPAHVIPFIHPRSVVTVHDLGYIYYPQAHRAFDRLYLDLSTRFNVKVASQIIADSEATENDLVQKYRVAEERITVVYPGCNLEPVIDGTGWERVKERYRLPDRYILHLGTLHPRKNILRLLEAFQRLARDYPELHLVLAGKKGWLYKEILSKAEGLGERVHFPGYIASEDLPFLIRKARLFILPSLYEGFGFPILEAMAAGTPVVCSNASALPEVAGDAALLFDPYDVEAMRETTRKVLEDEALRAELVERGLERAKAFSWERCARQTLSVLEKVAGSDG